MKKDDAALLKSLHEKKKELSDLLQKYRGEWEYEDPVYRMYHQSFKVYRVQAATKEIVELLKSLLPGVALNKDFEQIYQEGTGKTFEIEHNKRWLEETRPLIEAFFHARFFLEMAVQNAEMEEPPEMLPSGWAALLYLYNLR